jgi:prophage antirepressor-like protein
MTSTSLITVSTNDVIISLKDINSTNIIETIKFNNHYIDVYGTFEDPLFKAKDIGSLLEIDQIRNTLKNIDEKDKLLILAPVNNDIGNREQYFVTEFGLYEILFISRKPLAKEFKLYVKNILKDLRLTKFNILKNEYDNKLLQIENIKHIDKLELTNNQNIQTYDNQPGIYILIKEFNLNDEYIYFKFGSTSNITNRLKDHKYNFKKLGFNIYLYLFYSTLNYMKLEEKIRNDDIILKHKVNYNNHDEMFSMKNQKKSFDVVNKIFKNIITIGKQQLLVYDKDLEIEKEKTKQEELKLKEKQEETKQKELDFKMMCIQNGLIHLIENKQKEEIAINTDTIIEQPNKNQEEYEIKNIAQEQEKNIETVKINKPVIKIEKLNSVNVKKNNYPKERKHCVIRPKSGKYIGVFERKHDCGTITYMSLCIYNKNKTYLGSYRTKELAASVYDYYKKNILKITDKNLLNNIDIPDGWKFDESTTRLVTI